MAASGFTLVEILIAATLGALLLVATASSAGLFGTELQDLRAEQDVGLEESLTAITDDVRYAWWAEVPNSTTLTLADPLGQTTTYAFRKDRLIVQRPNGEQGVLIDGLTSGSFSAEMVTRYREGTPATRGGTLWSASLPVAAVPTAIVLEVGDRLALGLTPASAAPVGQSLVAGITEQLVEAQPTTLALPLVAVAPVAGTVQVDLYRARAPDDARPEGSSLATVTLSPLSLPLADSYVWDTKKKKKVNVPNGYAWGWWKKHADYTLVVTPPAAAVSIDVTPLAGKLKPGYAYTFVIQITGTGAGGLAVTGAAIAGANNSGIALQVGAAGSMDEAAFAVGRTLSGTATVTKALATSTVKRVQIALEGSDGTKVDGSVTLIGQGMADDAWLGVLPGELEP